MDQYDKGFLDGQAAAQPDWISVDDREPESFISVLGAIKNPGDFPPVRECFYTPTVENPWFPALEEHLEITHWQPLPEPPERSEGYDTE